MLSQIIEYVIKVKSSYGKLKHFLFGNQLIILPIRNVIINAVIKTKNTLILCNPIFNTGFCILMCHF